MAPAAAKRARPSFSPPRPGKSKVTNPTKSTSINASKKKTPNGAAKAVQRPGPQKTQRRRGTGGTMKAIMGEADEDEDEDEDDDEGNRARVDEESEAESDEEPESSDKNDDDDADQDRASSTTSSPEPEFMLAEIVPAAPNTSKSFSGSSDPAIPVPLIHRIMQSHFTAPEKTTVAADARALFGAYVQIFVKEGIRRCVDEKKDREGAGGGGVDSGWLELEDLERVATQLCLDF